MEEFGYVNGSGGSLLLNSYNNKIATLYLKGLLLNPIKTFTIAIILVLQKSTSNAVPVHM